MKICDDYRSTKRSKILKHVFQKKENLECEIREKHPRSSLYKNISNKKDIYFKKFAEIYNYKCAYCGISSEIKGLISFEVDHFKCKSSFSDEEGGEREADKLSNLVLSCQPCNRKKREIVIDGQYKELLNIDNNKLYFLQTKEYDNENDNSNVIYSELNVYKFMFMGDAGIDKEKDILDKYNLSNVDVLKVGHHGSKTSSSKEFINVINPKYSIISVGKNNRYGHPNKEVLNNLENSKIYRTDQDGSIMFKIKNNKLKIETYNP